MRKIQIGRSLIIASAVFLSTTVTHAAEMDHSAMDHGTMDHSAMDHTAMDHSAMDHDAMNDDNVGQGIKSAGETLEKVGVMPASGKAREAGADGRYLMEPTSVHDNLAAQCAKASRGLVMLDNVTWAKCGGKPKGATLQVNATMKNAQPMAEGHEHAGHHMP